MQRRHFEYIADILVGLKSAMTDSEHGKLVRYFSSMLAATNFNFKDDVFYNRARGIKKAKPVRIRSPKSEKITVLEDSYWE